MISLLLPIAFTFPIVVKFLPSIERVTSNLPKFSSEAVDQEISLLQSLLVALKWFKVTGKEVFEGLENAVIVCNHNSLIDIPVSTPFLARANKTIAKKSFVYVPLFGWIYQFATVIVDRKNNESRRKSYEEMKRVLNNGLDMLIYPEGTRNKTSNPLKSFYDGAFRLSVDTQKPIVPVVILNTKRILPAKPILFLRPGKIILNILPAI